MTVCRIPLPLTGPDWAAIELPIPMSEDNWQLMLRVLDAMKLGVVAESEPAAVEAPS